MEKKTTRFLNTSLILVSLFCVVIFIGQVVCMNLMSEDAIRQLGVFYMSGIADQVTAHFGTTIELRLSQVESLVNAVPPARTAGGSPMQIELTYNARAMGFDSLALYTDDGEFHMIYGSQMAADVPEHLHRSVLGGKDNVCAGVDATGTPIVLIGVPAHYPMEDGGTSAALVAGLPTSYLSDVLESSTVSSIIDYSIIRTDGSYILHSSELEDTNYFDRVQRVYETISGKTPEQYAAELHGAMEANAVYTSEVLVDGERWNLYCTNLPDSDWHMLLKISHNTLDETVNLLQKRWSGISSGGCALIVCALLLVFVGYYRLTKMQMKSLDEARRTAEQARLAAERSNQAKNEFLSNMSHDIRTPMNGIMGMTSIAIGSLDDPPRVRACLKKIHVSSRHLLGLITDMLDMSKIGNGSLTLNMEPVSLREVMQNITTVIQPQIMEKNHHFHIYIHDIYHESVCSDRVRLSQILLNIISNAVKFTPEGGTICADLYEEPSPKGSGYVRSHLCIKDNGIGMSREFQKKIFEPFVREDNARVDRVAGAGMGLTITKHIVDAMGGSITVASEQGKGSEFHIFLDMELAAQQEKELRLPRRTVLAIGGDALANRLTADALNSIGLAAETAPDPERACQLIEQRRNGAAPIQLVLLDCDLPGRDGIEAARELAGRFGPELPVVLLTDDDRDELEKQAEEAGICGIISKPPFRSSLYYTLRPLIEEDAPQPEPQESSAPDGPDLTGRRILMAEDNELNWEIAHELLGAHGLEMEWAENGLICVEKFAASAPGWYDAVLMDLRMPVMTGFEAAAALRALDREDVRTVPIIAVSADAFPEDIQKCLDCGMNGHTAKPLDPDKVLAMLSEHLECARP